jgi:hypothetical protein
MDVSKENKLNELIILHLQGDNSPQEFEQLKQFLNDDPNAVELYVEQMMQYSALKQPGTVTLKDYPEESLPAVLDPELWQQLLEQEKTAPAIEIPKEKPKSEPVKMLKIETPPRHVNKFSLCTALVSAAAMAFAIIYVQIAPPPATTVATITDSIDAQWAQSKHPADIGSELWNNEGSRWLQKGTVKIEFDYGAKVIIEGPTEFELENAEEMTLHSGRLYAVVPGGATGFTVQTPYSTVIDLGTEFGVKVDFDGSTGVHMFKGKASLIPGQAGKKEEGIDLFAGQAKSINTHGQVSDIELHENDFLLPAQFDIMSKADKGSAYHRWLVYSRKLRRDPSLVAYYTFDNEGESPGSLLNLAESTHGTLDGALVAGVDSAPLPEWTRGRWPEKGALKFERDYEHHIAVKHAPALNLPEQLTIACWIWLADERGGGHIISKRAQGGGGQSRGQGVQFACFGETAALVAVDDIQTNTFQYITHNNPFNTGRPAGMSGQWQHVAVTCDSAALRVYVNGRLIETAAGRAAMGVTNEDLLIGKSLIIDYGLTGVVGDPLAFDGLIDEIAIFSRSLNGGEIRRMYQAGKP